MQAELTVKESQVADLQENIKSHQSETSKAKAELTTALAEMEKLKAAVFLTEPDTSEKFLALMKKVEQLDDALRPLSTGPSTLRLYMPLTAEFTEDGYDYEEPEHLEGRELYQYEED